MRLLRVVEDPRSPGAAWPFVARERRGWRMAPHRHAELEANLFLAGRAVYLIGGRRLDLAPGDLLWLHPRDGHALVSCDAACRFAILVFTPSLLDAELPVRHPLRARRGPAEPVRRLPLDRMRTLGRLAASLERETARTPGRSLAAGLAWWLHQAWEAWEVGDRRAVGAVHPAVAAALAAWNRDAGLGLDACARIAGISASRLRRLVRRDLGTGVAAWRNRVRLEAFLDRAVAAGEAGPNLLREALAAGFGSYPQFHRVFRAAFGVPPSRWREVAG